MAVVRCELPHPLFIILTVRCLDKATEEYPGLPLPQNAQEVETDFLNSGEHGVLVLVDEKQPDNPRLTFCTPRYELVCALTQQKDAWFAIRMAPLGLRTHNQLVRSALQVVPQTWGFAIDLAEFNQQMAHEEAPTGLQEILSAWKSVRRTPPAAPPRLEGISAAELAFLGNIDTLINLACEVELEQAARQERVPVQMGEALSATKWRFHVTRPHGFRVGDQLRAGSGESVGEFDGTVVEVKGSALILRFFQPPDARRVQKIEWLVSRISTRQYAIQHAAVQALRNGEALNPRLLGLLVENRYTPYPAPTIVNAPGRPNPAQKTMIERAMHVPDLLLTLGPPGTGKTDTIREIVTRHAALGKKVLVTSKNNKAVDNVLNGLENVHALRIGREEVVDPVIRPLLIDNRAAALQTGILENAGKVENALSEALARWPKIQSALALLSERTADWSAAMSTLEQEQTLLSNWQTEAYLRVERAIRRQEVHARQASAQLEPLRRQAEALKVRIESVQRFSQWPLIGGLVTLLAEHFARDWRSTANAYRDTTLDIRKARDEAHKLWGAYRDYVTASEQALQFKRRLAQAETTVGESREAILRTIETLGELGQNLPGVPVFALTPDTSIGHLHSALEELFSAWQTWHTQQVARQGLLSEWREALATRPQALYSTLIRSSDVIGATCIGVATDARFEDLEFDLVIADEAGQIQVMDLLVPLVRARRAVLVGDHLQLPPLVEPEIVQKIRATEPENQELGVWLEKSLFERLIERPETPETHKIMLDTQYRMPRQIADFISTQFYGGKYRTGTDRTYTDTFFGANPLVFIDTMKEVRHYEQRAEDGQGYSNPTEARLVCDLLLAYQAKGLAVGVIVPYKKQAEVIRRELRRRQSSWNEDELVSRIATVDSFQGREQEVILFSFTRSNAEGRIGFLAELRRLNVSLTRARRQLILIGDSVTLTNASDPAFASLSKALIKSAQIIPASELPRRLAS